MPPPPTIPFWLTPLVSTILGALAGFGGGLLSERFKERVAQIDRELDRIDEIHDLAGDVLHLALKGAASETELRGIANKRARLGQNLKRYLGGSPNWSAVNSTLAMLANSLKDVQDLAEPPRRRELQGDAKRDRAAELEGQIQHRASALRSAVQRAASYRWAWILKRW